MSVNSSRWTSEMIIYGGEKAIVIVPVFMLPILHSVCLAWRYTALVLIGFAAYWELADLHKLFHSTVIYCF